MAESKKKSGKQPQKVGKQPQSATAKLELPDGYKPKKSSNKSSTNLNSGNMGKSKSKTLKALEADQKKLDAGILVTPKPMPPPPMPPILIQAIPILMNRMDELGLHFQSYDQLPRRLVFDNGRKWRSLEHLKDPQKFFKDYQEFQARKVDPKVFAFESPMPYSMSKENEAEYIKWFQQCRTQYYAQHGLLSKLRVLERTKNWPNIRCITAAPFVMSSEWKVRESEKNRNLGIFKLLNFPDIARGILSEIAEGGHLALCALGVNCKTGYAAVGQYIEVWDITPPGDYLNEDLYCLDGSIQRSPATLMVTPIRKPLHWKTRKRADFSYADAFASQIKLARALNNRANYVTNLQLHRVDFLDLNAVRCMLASLKRLSFLGIYQCPILHMGKMSELLELVRIHGRPNVNRQSYVNLDFFPMFHEGPNSLIRHGSYGAVWNHPNCDMATGIWQIVLYELYPKAMALGMDILRWGSAFRLFLEKLPMLDWAVVRIIDAVKAVEFSRVQRDVFDLRRYNVNEGKWLRFADNLTAALRGDNVEPAMVPGPHLTEVAAGKRATFTFPAWQRRYGWWRKRMGCVTCGKAMLAVFFPFGDHHCWGCMVKQLLDGQWDHFRTFKADAAAAWMGRYSDLNGAMKAAAAGPGYEVACQMDEFRALENKTGFSTDKPDWAGHANFPDLHRRYARHYESHGPVDRKFRDVQYYQVGKFGSGITSVMVTRVYLEWLVDQEMKDWERKGNGNTRPGFNSRTLNDAKSKAQTDVEARALVEYDKKRQKVLEDVEAKIHADGDQLIKAQNDKDKKVVEDLRQQYDRYQQWPNRQVKCWDEKIQEIFVNAEYRDKNGVAMLGMPNLILDRRPHFRKNDGTRLPLTEPVHVEKQW